MTIAGTFARLTERHDEAPPATSHTSLHSLAQCDVNRAGLPIKCNRELKPSEMGAQIFETAVRQLHPVLIWIPQIVCGICERPKVKHLFDLVN